MKDFLWRVKLINKTADQTYRASKLLHKFEKYFQRTYGLYKLI